MKKAVFFVGAFLVALAAGGYFLLKGSVVTDRVISGLVSKHYPVRVLLRNIRIESAFRVSFSAMTARPFPGKGEVRSLAGELRTDTPFFMARNAVFVLNDVRLDEELQKKALVFLGASPREPSGLPALRRVELKLQKKGRIFSLRVLKMDGGDFSMEGGLKFEAGHLQKADLRISLAEKLWSRLPGAVYSRMKKGESGRRSFQLLFCGHTLVLRGSGGPWLKAHWQSG